MQVTTIQPKLFFDPLNFRVGGLVMSNVQLSANHVGDEHRQGLSRTASSPNWAGEVDGDKLGTIHVVEQANLADAFQRSNEHRLGQDGEPNTQTNVNRFLKVVPLLTEATGDGLCDDNRSGFTVVFVQQSPNIIGDFVTLQMLDEEFFCSSRQIRCTGNFHPVFVVETELPSLFCDAISIVGSLVEPLMVS